MLPGFAFSATMGAYRFATTGPPVVKLHFLGTTGYHPNEKRQTACMMIPEQGIIFDAGTGFFRTRDLICTNTLDIFLSHAHLDHSIGLTFLYDVLWDKDIERVTVHVDGSKIPAIEQALYHKDLFLVGPNFDFKALKSEPVELANDIKVHNCSLEHPGGSNGFRLEHPGGSLAYITDTVAQKDAEYVEFISNVDVLIHECYFPDGWEDRAQLTGHSCLTPVAEVAAAANAGSTYLVHINPLESSDQPLDLASVKETYANLNMTEDRMVINL